MCVCVNVRVRVCISAYAVTFMVGMQIHPDHHTCQGNTQCDPVPGVWLLSLVSCFSICTHRRVVGKGALALVHSITWSRHPYGGHVRYQQLAQVRGHLRIFLLPASEAAEYWEWPREECQAGEEEMIGVIFNLRTADMPPPPPPINRRDVTTKTLAVGGEAAEPPFTEPLNADWLGFKTIPGDALSYWLEPTEG